MSVISNLPAMANRFSVACEYLYFLGEGGDSFETIEKQLSPLRSSDEEEQGDSDDGRAKSSIADAVLFEMEKLKLVTRKSKESIALAPEIRELAPKDGDWQKVLRPILFAKLVFPDVASSLGQAEVPDAISWLLAQDPLDPLPWKGALHAQRIINQLEDGDPLNGIRNNSRYQNLIYWSRYLGFAEKLSLKSGSLFSDMVIPDPSGAVTACLPSVFRDGNELPIQTFLQRLAELCPVLDAGSARRELEIRLTSQLQRKERHLSRSTSLALFRLQKRGVLELKAVSDANTFILDLGKETTPISHISLQGGTTA